MRPARCSTQPTPACPAPTSTSPSPRSSARCARCPTATPRSTPRCPDSPTGSRSSTPRPPRWAAAWTAWPAGTCWRWRTASPSSSAVSTAHPPGCVITPTAVCWPPSSPGSGARYGRQRRELDRLPVAPGNQARRHVLSREHRSLLDRLDRLQRLDELPAVQLLVFDPARGRIAVARGDVDAADHVTTFVPGTGTTLDDVDGLLERASDLVRAARRADPAGRTAAVAWLDYDAPSWPLQPTSSRAAVAGAEGPRRLRRGPAGHQRRRHPHADRPLLRLDGGRGHGPQARPRPRRGRGAGQPRHARPAPRSSGSRSTGASTR
jgi:hypothetical protein